MLGWREIAQFDRCGDASGAAADVRPAGVSVLLPSQLHFGVASVPDLKLRGAVASLVCCAWQFSSEELLARGAASEELLACGAASGYRVTVHRPVPDSTCTKYNGLQNAQLQSNKHHRAVHKTHKSNCGANGTVHSINHVQHTLHVLTLTWNAAVECRPASARHTRTESESFRSLLLMYLV